MKERKALKLAQKALSNRNAPAKTIYEALHAIKEALAQPEQEALAYEIKLGNSYTLVYAHVVNNDKPAIRDLITASLYTTPPQRTWVGLTDVEWMNIVNKDQAWFGQRPDEVAHEVAKMVEAKLREKNT